MAIQTGTIVRPFDYDVVAARSLYDQQGWFHAPGGVSQQMMAIITGQIAELMGTGDSELENWRYPEKKEQFLWQLPEGLAVEELCRVVAESTGLNPETTIVSERHLKVYSDTAPEMPPPHKDRSASTVTVGIGIDSPEDSRLMLWPESDTTFNPFPTAAEWRASRHPHELPEIVTEDAPTIEIDLRRGDVVMFRGANFYHERYRPACTSVLYLKFNDRALDPLGEDPRTLLAEQRSGELQESGIRADHLATVSPRVIGVRSDRLFPDLGVIETAMTIANDYGVRLSPDEASTLRRLAEGGPAAVGDLDVDIDLVERLLRWNLVLLSQGPGPSQADSSCG